MTRTTAARPRRWTVVAALALSPVLLLASASAARGQGAGGPQGPPRPHDPLAEHLFSPDLVMRHQAEIELSPDQRQALIDELQRTQTDMVPLQFEVQEASEALAKLISANRIDEERALAQAKRVMELETRARTLHLTLLLRIKNLLSPEQQERLAEIRRGSSG